MTNIFIDMDDTLCDFMGAYHKHKEDYPWIEYPQSQWGFFANLAPLPNAIECVNKLIAHREIKVYFLTRPSYMNPNCYTEKRLWIEKHFGLDICKNLILCTDKSLIKGHGPNNILVDDVYHMGFAGVQVEFGSEQFPDWLAVMEYFKWFGLNFS